MRNSIVQDLDNWAMYSNRFQNFELFSKSFKRFIGIYITSFWTEISVLNNYTNFYGDYIDLPNFPIPSTPPLPSIHLVLTSSEPLVYP